MALRRNDFVMLEKQSNCICIEAYRNVTVYARLHIQCEYGAPKAFQQPTGANRRFIILYESTFQLWRFSKYFGMINVSIMLEIRTSLLLCATFGPPFAIHCTFRFVLWPRSFLAFTATVLTNSTPCANKQLPSPLPLVTVIAAALSWTCLDLFHEVIETIASYPSSIETGQFYFPGACKKNILDCPYTNRARQIKTTPLALQGKNKRDDDHCQVYSLLQNVV